MILEIKSYLRMFDNTHPANSLSAFVPALWAQQSLKILQENMVIGSVINRDFSPIIANYGDTVNTRRPVEFTAVNKVVGDDVTIQVSSANNVSIVLNQHTHVSFLLQDADLSKSFLDLSRIFMEPAALALARSVDRTLLYQVYQFMGHSFGTLGGLTSSNAPAQILGTRKVMNQAKAPLDPRYMFHSANAESNILNNQIFQTAYSVGDDGTALKKALLGEKLGFTHFMSQNTPSILGVSTVDATGAINHAAGYGVGATALTVDGYTGSPIVAGNWITIAGDVTPLHVASVALTSSNITTITLAAPGLRNAVVDNAIITGYTSPASTSASYAAGYNKTIAYSGDTFAEGQLVTFGTDTNVYAIKSLDLPTAGFFTLDRPLVAAVTSSTIINPGPAGDYSFALHPNAFTVVHRPLALPPEGSGVRAGYATYKDMSIRVTAQYLGVQQGLLVTMDFLWGVQTLDTNLGAVMFA